MKIFAVSVRFRYRICQLRVGHGRVEDGRLAVHRGDVAAPEVPVQHGGLHVDALEEPGEAWVQSLSFVNLQKQNTF